MSAIVTRIDQQDAAPAITPMAMLDRAVASGAGIETLEKLMALQERWEANQARRAFDEALSAAKSEIPVIGKTKLVEYAHQDGRGHTSYVHETLDEIARVVTPILGRYGLSYRFRTSSEINQPVTVTCIISHRDGHSEENTLTAPRDESGKKNGIQSIGSTITYLQRYTLKAALGLAAAADDDGKGAGGDETISDEQLERLQSLIVEVGADVERFLTYFKAPSLSDIPAMNFDEAVRKLEAKRRRA